MQTQIRCPQCSTTFPAQVFQLIDAQRQPELKQMLMNGQLNVAVCPSCQAMTQIASPLVFHDADHDLFMVHIPQELGMTQMQQTEMVGRLTRGLMESLPPEQRRAYLLQPQTILTMQTFMEKVLETEGITREMIERQQKQAELLNTMAQADPDVVDYLIKERGREIDETFFAMLRQYVQTAQQMEDNSALLPLINLQAKLMQETAVGRRLEKQQIAMHKLSQSAKKAGGLTHAVLLDHVLLNQEDEEVVQGLVMAGQQALSYEFFSGLTLEIEKQEAAGDKVKVARLTRIRTNLLEMFEEMREASQRVVNEADELLEQIVKAPDLETAVQQNAAKMDDAFMYVLSQRMAQAQQDGRNDIYRRLSEIQAFIMRQVENQAPPEIQLLTKLVQAESDEARRELLDENKAMLSPDLLQVVDVLLTQVKGNPDRGDDMVARLETVRAMIEMRV
ncbi:MAG: CpXC domain-containing protein [Chloroflexota bacterium]